MNNNFLKNVAVWLLIGFLVFLIVDFYNSNNTVNNIKPISYSNFLNDVKNGNVSSVQIRGNNITGRYNNGSNLERSLLSIIQSFVANPSKMKNFLIRLLCAEHNFTSMRPWKE